jgi:hypothetical protein
MSEFSDVIDVLGGWKKEDSELACKKGNNILTQSLLDCKALYPSRRLTSLAEKRFKHALDDNGLFIKEGKTRGERRFVVHVGHHDNHVAYWSNKWAKNPIVASSVSFDKNPTNFLDAITKHYVSCFRNDEGEYIANALQLSEHNVHIIVYYKYRDTIKRDSNESTPRNEVFYIAAAATIRFAESSTTLLYLGTSNHEYSPEEDFYPKGKNDDKNDPNNVNNDEAKDEEKDEENDEKNNADDKNTNKDDDEKNENEDEKKNNKEKKRNHCQYFQIIILQHF